MVICLQRGADLNMAQLIPSALTVSCFSKIEIGFNFLVLAHPESLGQRAVKRVCVCVYCGDDISASIKYRTLKTTKSCIDIPESKIQLFLEILK